MNETPQDSPATAESTENYRVLARKYRPQTFEELIGQEALVRTLSNAIEAGRLAHAFILTGVRGVGKTTTARLIARALNCTGAGNDGGPTIHPCGTCDSCVSIAESRNVDVLEMDAASHTGVDDIREIIDGARYAPVSARHKVYIIDEVHMLSKSAFNALLKTLEEPPDHVVFIFATTEVRKVPVTVLSRCQRFDLRRVDAAALKDHFTAIAGSEGVKIEDGALNLIVRAAEGSVRDGLSLLDQAIAHGAGKVGEEQVRDMLGLADRAMVLDLFEAVMAGEVEAALDNLRDQYNAGADPLVILRDLAELTHWLTRIKAVPGAIEDASMSEAERTKGKEMAGKLALPQLARSWQMLLKGLEEVRLAHNPVAAAEMVIIRMAYIADMPPPADLVKELKSDPAPAETAPDEKATAPAGPADDGAAARASSSAASSSSSPPAAAPGSAEAATADAPEPRLDEQAERAQYDPQPQSFEDVVELFTQHDEMVLQAHLTSHVKLVRFQPGRIEINVSDQAPPDLANEVGRRLGQWTGERWVVSVSGERGGPSLREKRRAAEQARRDEAMQIPLVRAALETFKGARITRITDREPAPAADDTAAADGEQENED